MRSAGSWDGSSWTDVTEMSTSRASGQGTANAAATGGLAFGGYDPTASPSENTANLCEEWGATGLTNKTITVS